MMGFSGFGKKAREFDIEKLAEDAKKDAEERNRANIGKPRVSLVAYQFSALVGMSYIILK